VVQGVGIGSFRYINSVFVITTTATTAATKIMNQNSFLYIYICTFFLNKTKKKEEKGWKENDALPK